MSSPRSPLVGSLALSLPWCCIVPAALALAGASGAIGARLWLAQASWLVLPVAGGLLVRAWWLAWRRRQGGSWARMIVLVSSLLAVGLWLPRLAPLVGGLLGGN